MKLIKNAIAYRIDLPMLTLLEGHIAAQAYTEIKPNEHEKFGFVHVPVRNCDPVEGDPLIMPFYGGLAFSVRIDEKIMPASVIKAEVKKRCAEYCAKYDQKRVDRIERDTIHQMVVSEFLSRAMVKTAVVTAFYHSASKFLFVAGTKRQADIVTSLLVHAVGAAKTETINVSDVMGGLTTRMRAYVDEGTGFDEAFILDSGVWLSRGKDRVTAKMEHLIAAQKAIQEALDGGFRVEAVRLTHVDTDVSFKLTSDFHVKSISGLDAVDPDDSCEDAVDLWTHDASAQVTMLVEVFESLCAMFDYKAPETDASQADGGGDE